MGSETEDLASTARRLIEASGTGALGTIACAPPRARATSIDVRHAGHPFVSLVAIAVDARGRPLLLLSGLAEHTKNLAASPKASILVTDAPADGDPLARARVTLTGACARVAEAERDAVRDAYLARHPEASAWASFADFGFFRLEPEAIRVVAGFGRMAWLSSADYFSQFDIAPRS